MLIALVVGLHQFKLESDYDRSGVILTPSGKLNVLEKYVSITYAIDISILDKVKVITPSAERDCYSEARKIDSFNKKIFDNTVY